MSAPHHNVLDFSVAFFGCAEEQDLLQAIAAADVRRLEAWLDGYGDFASTTRLKSRDLEPGEIRPYFQTRTRWLPWTRGGLDSKAETFAFADEIKHRLLYSHSLAIDDELGRRLDDCIRKLKVYPDAHGSRDPLVAYANLLLHVAPLLRTDILCMVSPPEYVADAPSLKPQLKDEMITLATDAAQEFDLSELAAAAPPETREKWQQVLDSGEESERWGLRRDNLIAACDRLAYAAQACAHLPGKLTMYLPFRYDVHLLSLCLRTRMAQLLPKLPDADNLVIKHLADMTLPGLASLDPGELVAVRQSSEEFEAWRASLRNALRTASTTPSDLFDRDEEVRRAFRDSLTDAKRRLEESLGRSQLRPRLATSAVSLMCGALSVGVAALLSPLATAAAVAASLAGVAASETLKAIAKPGEVKSPSRAKRQAQEALVQHYAAVMQ
jgi:hypothetical protein